MHRSLLLLGFLAASPALANPVIIITRHAEKTDDSSNARLSPAGHARARALATRLRDARLSHIFVTQVERTQETAAPTATSLNLKPTIIPADQTTTTLVERLKGLGGKDVALVVSHSDRMAGLWKALGCAAPADVTSKDFDQLWMVVTAGKDAPTCTQLRLDGM